MSLRVSDAPRVGRGVRFAYPSRPDEVIFKDFSLTVEPGTTVAIVSAWALEDPFLRRVWVSLS